MSIHAGAPKLSLNLTDRARNALAAANGEAQRFNHEYIGTEHLLLGIVKEGNGVGANVLKNLEINLRKVRLEVEKLVKSGPDMVTMGKLPFTPRTKRVMEFAEDEARKLKHNYIGTEHLLLGLLREHDGVAAQVLMNFGVKLEEARDEILNLLGAGVDDTEQDVVNTVLNETLTEGFKTLVKEDKIDTEVAKRLNLAENSLRQLVAAVSACGSVEQIRKATSLLEELRVLRDQCKHI